MSISDCSIVNVISKTHPQTQALGEMLFPFFTDDERDMWGEAEKQVHTVAERKDPGTDESQAAWPARGIRDGLQEAADWEEEEWYHKGLCH